MKELINWLLNQRMISAMFNSNWSSVSLKVNAIP